MEHESPPQPERAPPIPISELDSVDFVSRVVREVSEHACEKYGKSSLLEVNMLDALASFEEIMVCKNNPCFFLIYYMYINRLLLILQFTIFKYNLI